MNAFLSIVSFVLTILCIYALDFVAKYFSGKEYPLWIPVGILASLVCGYCLGTSFSLFLNYIFLLKTYYKPTKTKTIWRQFY